MLVCHSRKEVASPACLVQLLADPCEQTFELVTSVRFFLHSACFQTPHKLILHAVICIITIVVIPCRQLK